MVIFNNSDEEPLVEAVIPITVDMIVSKISNEFKAGELEALLVSISDSKFQLTVHRNEIERNPGNRPKQNLGVRNKKYRIL